MDSTCHALDLYMTPGQIELKRCQAGENETLGWRLWVGQSLKCEAVGVVYQNKLHTS